jgi:hypothetical protein
MATSASQLIRCRRLVKKQRTPPDLLPSQIVLEVGFKQAIRSESWYNIQEWSTNATAVHRSYSLETGKEGFIR